MFQSIKNKPYLPYIFLYSFSFMVYGTLIASLGPLIPFLSENTGLAKTQYSYLFGSRACTMILGGFLTKWLQRKKVENNKIIIIASLILGILSGLFSMVETQLWLGIWFSLSCIGYSLLEITINVGIISVTPPHHLTFWMLVTHGFAGVGALIGPLLVCLFKEQSYLVFGFLALLTIPFYASIQPSQELQQFSNSQHQLKTTLIQNNKESKSVSKHLEYCLCFLIFIQRGMQNSFGGWISSYTVMVGVADKEGATFLSSIYWTLATAVAFLFVCIKGTSNKKLEGLIHVGLFGGISSLVLVKMGFYSTACYSSSILFGVAVSSMCPLILTFPVEEGLKLQDEQVSSISTSGAISQGVLTMMMGELMTFNINFIFYCMIFFAVAMWITHRHSINLINEDKVTVQNTFFNMELKDMGNTATTTQTQF